MAKRHNDYRWVNWYINRGRVPARGPGQDERLRFRWMRQVSWRRTH